MNNTDKIIAEAIDHLTYSSYAHNRELSPEIAPIRWGLIYGTKKVELMEKIFQNTLTAAK
tara:strand:- start:3710 stop:3889 length:180 start_codon:yes stop_codon:yes gene_type:complete